MSTKKPNYIKTERLTLRPIEICDLQIIQNYSIDQEWHRFLDFHTKESVKEFVQKAVNSNWEEHARFSILIDNKMVGGVGLYIEMKNKTAEIGHKAGVIKNPSAKTFCTPKKKQKNIFIICLLVLHVTTKPGFHPSLVPPRDPL